MIVSNFMTKDVTSCNENQTVKDAAEIMISKSIGGVPILDNDGNFVGMITESDFIGKKVDIPRSLVSLTEVLGQTHHKGDIDDIFEKAKCSILKDIMSKNPQTIKPETTISEASSLMLNNNISRLPVVEGGKLVGIFTKRDILKSFVK